MNRAQALIALCESKSANITLEGVHEDGVKVWVTLTDATSAAPDGENVTLLLQYDFDLEDYEVLEGSLATNGKSYKPTKELIAAFDKQLGSKYHAELNKIAGSAIITYSKEV